MKQAGPVHDLSLGPSSPPRRRPCQVPNQDPAQSVWLSPPSYANAYSQLPNELPSDAVFDDLILFRLPHNAPLAIPFPSLRVGVCIANSFPSSPSSVPFVQSKMPGILPMKVIKVGSNAQSRVAQACDRCRSKKIRCDGVTPCCSQCANVGFECKTSDKLSRRAFPRGYTESLEERVRALEGEVRELKDLLDSKDEKIDMLSRIHPSSPPTKRPTSVFSSSTNPTSPASSTDPHGGKEDASIDVGQQSTGSGDDDISTMSSASASNGKCFIGQYLFISR